MSNINLSKRIVSFVKARRPNGYLPFPVVAAYMYMETGAKDFAKFSTEVSNAIHSSKDLVAARGRNGGVALAITHANRKAERQTFKVSWDAYREMSPAERTQVRLIRDLKKLQKLSPAKFAKLSSVITEI